MLAEAKLAGEKVDLAKLEKQLKPIQMTGLDTLVLGCTHFPIVAKEIQQVLGQGVALLDSGKAVAQRVCFLLEELKNDEVVNQESNWLAVYTTKTINEGLTTRLAEKGFTTIVSRSSANLG